MAQPERDRPVGPVGKHDVWVQWPDVYRPDCPACSGATIGLLDRGRYVQGGLRIDTTAEPCGCALSADQVLAMQAAAIRDGALPADLETVAHPERL